MSQQFAYQLDVLACPRCSATELKPEGGETLRCPSCQAGYPIEHGIPVLLHDPEARTLLDLDEYEEVHPIDKARSERTYRLWEKILEQHGERFDSVLEIGSGLGNLTYGLSQFSPYKDVHCSDISVEFLLRLSAWVPTEGKNFFFYAFDANHAPFQKEQFDAVLGHSVLHHLLDYEGVLQETYGLVRPGGVVGFSEPVLDAWALDSFLAALILVFEERLELAGFDNREMGLLRGMSTKAADVARLMRDERQQLAAIEDKHFFGVREIYALARDVGFREVIYTNGYYPASMSAAFKYNLDYRLKRQGVPEDKLAAYDFLFTTLADTYLDALGPETPLHFGFFLFKK